MNGLRTDAMRFKSSYLKGDYDMPYKIGEECISCGACAEECPIGCISEGDGKYEIDAEQCIDCGTCESTCPVGAPKQE